MDGTAAAQLQAMAGEREMLVPADQRVQIEEEEANNKCELNHIQKKWLLFYWLLIVVSVMILTNLLFFDGGQDGHVVFKNPYIALVKFMVFLCAICCLMFHAIK